MYIDIVPNRKSPPAILLRESVRLDGKIVKRTLANLSCLSVEQAQALRQILKGQPLAPVGECFEVRRSRHHGHIKAITAAMRRLGMAQLIGSRRCDQRDCVLAMIAARIADPQSKLATARWWQTTTLPEHFEIEGAEEQRLYQALDWLAERQEEIEARLAKRHLRQGGQVLYDLSSSYFEGVTCPLAARGYSRDGKKGKLQVNYGLLTDREGRPVSISAFEGNTADSTTLMGQVDRLQARFGIESMVLIGDRGMISQRQIEQLSDRQGLEWITALKSGAIRALLEDESIQLGLFDEFNLFEFSHPDYPNERLVACRNDSLARQRAHKRQALLEASAEALDKVRVMVEAGRLRGRDRIGVRVGKVVNRYKMAKHLRLDIGEQHFAFHVDASSVAREAALDGLYVIRTNLPAERMDSHEAVRCYKNLSQVERAFRSLKSIDLEVRPIHHRLTQRVRAHLFLCMLAYYVKWHMMEAWRPLLFADENVDAKRRRDPVAPATRSADALAKVKTKRLPDGDLAHSFHTLLADLSTLVRNTCHHKGVAGNPIFTVDTQPNPTQQRALQLIQSIRV